MALPLPNLDDRTYEQLVSEMIELLPRFNEEWTNQNPSDPGVMLLELFAYLVEMDIFQLNRVTPKTYANFLKLVEVDPPLYYDPPPTADEIATGIYRTPTMKEVQKGIGLALQNLAYIRTISEVDMNEVIESVLLPRGIITRVYSFSNRYLKKDEWRFDPVTNQVVQTPVDIDRPVDIEMEKEGYTLLILSADNTPYMREQDVCLQTGTEVNLKRDLVRYTLSAADLHDIEEALRERRILTNRLYVHQAQFRSFVFYIKVVPEKTADLGSLPEEIKNNLLDYFCPVWGGEEGTGFALGRTFKVTEAIAVIEETLGVDYTDEFKAWYKDSTGAWENVNQVFEPLYYEQCWVESGVLTGPKPVHLPELFSGITVEVMPLDN